MDGIPIERLNLSRRATNMLHRMSIDYVEQMIGIPIEKIADQRNVGVKTVAEISDVLHRIEIGEIDIDSLFVPINVVNAERKNHFSYDQLVELSRYPITELDVPTRALNALMAIQCFTIDKVVVLSEEEIGNLKGLGVKSTNELISGIYTWLSANMFLSDCDDDEEIGLEEMDYFQRLEKILDPITHIYWKTIRQYVENTSHKNSIIVGGYGTISNENISALLELSELEVHMKNYFLKLVPAGVIKVDQLRERLYECNLDFDCDILLDKLCDGSICTMREGYCFINRSHILNFITENCTNTAIRNNNILIKRIYGENFQTIGEEYGLTRERVRQILIKIVRKLPLMYEDFFREPYEYFKFSKEEFCKAFPSCTEEGYEYLFIRYLKGKEILTLDSLKAYNGVFVERLGEYLKEESIRQHKRTVSRIDMIYRVLLSNGDKTLSLDEFEVAYYDYIESKGYPRERLELNVKTAINHMRNAKCIVFDKSNCVRYCDAAVGKIWNNINFKQYKDCVVSTELIFRDYDELMEELDIRDGYELFYVIKSSLECWNRNEFEINCRRVPVIVFGIGDEERQAVQLLKEVSPVGYYEYYEIYEERYGIRKDSALGNPSISNSVGQYLSDGQYSIDVALINEKDIESFKDALSHQIVWFMDELEGEFCRVCVNSSMDAMNAAAFKRIGYSLNAGYAYNNSYRTITNFFNVELFSKDILDLTTFDQRLIKLPAFISALEKKKHILEYVEIAPKILMSIDKVKEQFDIDKGEIRTLQEWILTSCDDKYFNAYSIWKQILENCIVKKIQDNEWMCTCILRQHESVFSLSVAGNMILSKNSGELSLGKICEWLIEKNGRMDIQALTNLFNKTYGTNVPYYKIADKLKAYGDWNHLVTDSFEDYIDTLVGNANIDEDSFFKEEFF